MADSNMQLQWTDDQWNKVRQVVYEEARRARVAGNFLPLYGPLEPDARYVTNEFLTYGTAPSGLNGKTVKVDDLDTLLLSTLQVEVFLSGAQVADPQLTSALTAFRRAANVVARLEDEIIFNGQPDVAKRPMLQRKIAGRTSRPPSPGIPTIGDVIGGEQTHGLLASPRGGGLPPPRVAALPPVNSRHIIRAVGPQALAGEALVRLISKAIGDLEERHQLGPFACVLGHQYFNDVQTPQPNSMVLPQDRILPFLGGGTLLRTSTLPDDVGLVIALGGEPIDLVVGTDISVKFLQVTLDPCFVFRVYEKIVLRIKQPDAIAVVYFTTLEGIMDAIRDALTTFPNLTEAQAREVNKRLAASEALSKDDKHQESLDKLAEAQKILCKAAIPEIQNALKEARNLSREQWNEANSLLIDGETLHEDGKHDEALEALANVKKLLQLE